MDKMQIDVIIESLKRCPFCQKIIPDEDPCESYEGQQFHKICGEKSIKDIEAAMLVLGEVIAGALQPFICFFDSLNSCGLKIAKIESWDEVLKKLKEVKKE